MLELGHAAEELHREVGRYAAAQGVDLLIGVRGERAAHGGGAVGAGFRKRRVVFRGSRRRRATSSATWPRPGDAVLFKGSRGVRVERALERFRWRSTMTSMLYFLLYEQLYRYVSPFRVFRYTTFRTAFASLTALFLCIALGPWLISKLRQFQIGQYIREEGPQVASEEGRHAHHGRRADHHLHRGPHAAVGRPALSATCGSRSPRCWATAGSASWTTTPR